MGILKGKLQQITPIGPKIRMSALLTEFFGFYRFFEIEGVDFFFNLALFCLRFVVVARVPHYFRVFVNSSAYASP